MKINVLLFGRLAYVAEDRFVTALIEGDECKVGDLIRALYSDYPDLRKERFRVVRNHIIAADGDFLAETDEVALLPPISGGSFTYFTHDPIDTDYINSVSNSLRGDTGSVLTFAGVVRSDRICCNSGEGAVPGEVVSITYSAYENMAEGEIDRIITTAKEKFGLTDVIVRHRLGEVKVGETAFFVSVFSGHRKEGIRGIDYVIDEVKSRVPVWKLERFDDGSERWKDGKLIESDPEDRIAGAVGQPDRTGRVDVDGRYGERNAGKESRMEDGSNVQNFTSE